MTTGPYCIIGLTGRARAGKDTAADILARVHGFRRVAFADAVRREIVDAFGVDLGLFSDMRKGQPTIALAIGRCSDPDFIRLMVKAGYSADTPRTPRQIMQWWGTDYRRRQLSDYWLEPAAEAALQALRKGARRVVFTDVRFPNEAAMIRRWSGSLWRVRRARADGVSDQHTSEQQVDAIPVDLTVYNDGSLDTFADNVLRSYGELRG